MIIRVCKSGTIKQALDKTLSRARQRSAVCPGHDRMLKVTSLGRSADIQTFLIYSRESPGLRQAVRMERKVIYPYQPEALSRVISSD